MDDLPPILPVEVRFSLTKSLWFDMVFVVGRQGRIVETCDTVWDIGQLTCWLQSIVKGEANPEMEVDREGLTDCLEARYVDEERVRLRIYEWGEPIEASYVDALVSKKQLVWEIYFEMNALSLELGKHYRPERAVTDPNWLRLPEVEKWLDWEKNTNSHSMQNIVQRI